MTSPLSGAQLKRAYRQMKTIREFEERLHVEIATGEIPDSRTCMRARKPWRSASANTSTTPTTS